MEDIGHNSGDVDGRVRSIVERLVHSKEEQKACAEDFKEILAEAKSDGLNPAALREIVKRTMRDASAREKLRLLEVDVDVYLAAIGRVD